MYLFARLPCMSVNVRRTNRKALISTRKTSNSLFTQDSIIPVLADNKESCRQAVLPQPHAVLTYHYNRSLWSGDDSPRCLVFSSFVALCMNLFHFLTCNLSVYHSYYIDFQKFVLAMPFGSYSFCCPFIFRVFVLWMQLSCT